MNLDEEIRKKLEAEAKEEAQRRWLHNNNMEAYARMIHESSGRQEFHPITWRKWERMKQEDRQSDQRDNEVGSSKKGVDLMDFVVDKKIKSKLKHPKKQQLNDHIDNK